MLKAVRWHHIAAAFVGVVLVGYVQWSEPAVSNPGRAATVLGAALIFGLLWECIIRLSRWLVHGRLTRE